jgi:hypothetical protein
LTHVWPRGDGSQRVREVFPAVGEGGEARWRSTDKAIALARSRLGTIRHSDLLIGRVERLLLVGRRVHLLGGELGRRLRGLIFGHAPCRLLPRSARGGLLCLFFSPKTLAGLAPCRAGSFPRRPRQDSCLSGADPSIWIRLHKPSPAAFSRSLRSGDLLQNEGELPRKLTTLLIFALQAR